MNIVRAGGALSKSTLVSSNVLLRPVELLAVVTTSDVEANAVGGAEFSVDAVFLMIVKALRTVEITTAVLTFLLRLEALRLSF